MSINISLNDHLENIRIFKDIKKNKYYSPFSIKINGILGEKTFDSFQKNLIANKKAKIGDFRSLFEKPKKFNELKIYEEPFNINIFKKSLKDMQKKKDELSYKIRNPYKIRKKLQSTTSLKTEKLLRLIKKNKLKKELKKKSIYLPSIPEVGRYNPDYDMIRKHSYEPSFCTETFDNFNKSGINHNERNIFNIKSNVRINQNNNNKNKEIKYISYDMAHDNKNNDNKNEYLNTSPTLAPRGEQVNNISTNESNLIRNNGDPKLRCKKHLNNIFYQNKSLSFEESKLNKSANNNSSINYSIFESKDNHCLSFDVYSKRKPFVRKMSYTTEFFSNPESYHKNYKKNNACVEFNKISTSKEKKLCYFEVQANRNNNPPLGLYHPKFETTFNKTINNIFLNKNWSKFDNKKKLKKIIFRYNVPTKYLLFQTLNEKKKNNLSYNLFN